MQWNLTCGTGEGFKKSVKFCRMEQNFNGGRVGKEGTLVFISKGIEIN